MGVNGSYAEEADEKLVLTDGQDMDWLDMLKPSSMSNRNSDSNCMVARVCLRECDILDLE